MYDLNLSNIEDGYEDAIRIRLGVDSTELTNDMINSLSIVGATEALILELIPTADAIDDIKDSLSLNLAFMNIAAYYAWPGLKLRLLQIESDNKSIAQRFAKAIDIDPLIFLQEGQKYLYKITTVAIQAASDISMLDISSPNSDELTGMLNS